MSLPQPPFRTVAEELLYEIYNKITGNMNGLKAEDINTLAKLNALLIDADLVSVESFVSAISSLKGNVPTAGNTLEKLYNLIQGLNYLSREDIDTLAEINAVLTDADLVRTEDLSQSVSSLRGNPPATADTLEKLHSLIQSASKKRIIQFEFKYDDCMEQVNLFKGQINSLSQDLTNALSSVSYKTRLDLTDTWTSHANLISLQIWINANITGDEMMGTKFWIKCLATYKSGKSGEARNVLYYSVL